jgi:hypothetical protein
MAAAKQVVKNLKTKLIYYFPVVAESNATLGVVYEDKKDLVDDLRSGKLGVTQALSQHV